MGLYGHGHVLPATSPALQRIVGGRCVDTVKVGHGNDGSNQRDSWGREFDDSFNNSVPADLYIMTVSSMFQERSKKQNKTKRHCIMLERLEG